MALWTPANLTTQPDWWFDAADDASITLNGSGVLNWADKGTAGGDAYQTTAGSQPQRISNALNGKPIIRFASGQRLLFPSTRALKDKTLILVFKNNGGGSPFGIGASRINTSSTGQFNLFSTLLPYGNTGNQTSVNNIGSGFGIMHSGLHSTLEIYINGVKDQTNPTRTNASEQFRYAGIVNPSFSWLADLAEILLLPAEPSDDDRQKIEGYIAHKWGITSRLLPGHPYFNTAPVTEIVVPVSVPNAPDGARYRIWNSTRNAEIANALVSGSTGISTTFIADDDSVPHLENDDVVVDITYPVSTTAYLPSRVLGKVTQAGVAGFVAQQDDTIYNFHGIDGSALTKFTPDFVDDDIELAIAENFLGAELYAYYVHILHSEAGIREWLGAVTAIDNANFRINVGVMPLLFDNQTDTEVWQLDNVRVFRSDEARPVRHPTMGGGGIDMQWRSQVYTSVITVSGSSVITGDISTVLAAVGNPMQASSYVAPANADIAAIKAKTDVLVNTDVSMLATAAQVSELPTLAEIESSGVLAKEATLATKASQSSVSALGTPLQEADYVVSPTLVEITTSVVSAVEDSDVLAKEATTQKAVSNAALAAALSA
jgi:hypothetical protein